jgi:hypothetical protein
MARKKERSDDAFNAPREDTTLSQKLLNVARALNARIWSMRENRQASAYRRREKPLRGCFAPTMPM